jgi:hypothetical protein
LHFAVSDLLVDTRTVFLDGRRGSHWSANGAGLLYCCERARCGESHKNPVNSPASQRECNADQVFLQSGGPAYPQPGAFQGVGYGSARADGNGLATMTAFLA